MTRKKIHKYFEMSDRELIAEHKRLGREYLKCFDEDYNIIDFNKEHDINLEDRFVVDAMYCKGVLDWDLCDDPDCWKSVYLGQRRYKHGHCLRMWKLKKKYDEWVQLTKEDLKQG